MLAHTQIYFISPSSIFVISYHKLLTISRLKNSYDFFYHLTDNSLIISVLLLLHRQISLLINHYITIDQKKIGIRADRLEKELKI